MMARLNVPAANPAAMVARPSTSGNATVRRRTAMAAAPAAAKAAPAAQGEGS